LGGASAEDLEGAGFFLVGSVRFPGGGAEGGVIEDFDGDVRKGSGPVSRT
jgi:hypothetical protein